MNVSVPSHHAFLIGEKALDAMNWWIVTAIVVVIAVFTIGVVLYRPEYKPLMSKLNAITILSAIVGLFYTIASGESNRVRDYVLRTREMLNTSYEKIQDLIVRFFPASWPLYRELNRDSGLPVRPLPRDISFVDGLVDRQQIDVDIEKMSRPLAESLIAKQIVNFTTTVLRMQSTEFDADRLAYFRQFVEWWRSPILRKEWEGLRSYTEDITVDFIDLLIPIAESNESNTKAAEELALQWSRKR